MLFTVFQCTTERDRFVVTDEDHASGLTPATACPDGGGFEKIGEFAEMGADRVAFDEALAKRAIKDHGYFSFHAKTFDPVAEMPLAMPA